MASRAHVPRADGRAARTPPERRARAEAGVLALQRSVGNRAVGAIVRRPTLARDVEAEQAALEARAEPSISALAQEIRGLSGDTRGFKIQNLVWRMINTWAPDSVDALFETRYDRSVAGFAVRDVAATKGTDAHAFGTLVLGDDAIDRAAGGKLSALAEELRGALWQIHSVDLAAGRPAVIRVGSERVRVTSKAEVEQAPKILANVKKSYGVVFDSLASRRAARARYGGGSVTDDQLRATDVDPWDFKEIQAIERALKHFAPVLGDARRKSTLKSAPQEVVTMGKLTVAPDDDPADLPSRGEYFRDGRAAVLYKPRPLPKDEVDERTEEQKAKDLEGRATHEIAHGVFGDQLKAFMAMTGYWDALHVKSRKRDAEGPPDGYADTNASEDLAQSVMYYFVDPQRLKKGDGKRGRGTWGNPCPKRFAFIDAIVGGWTPKR